MVGTKCDGATFQSRQPQAFLRITDECWPLQPCPVTALHRALVLLDDRLRAWLQ